MAARVSLIISLLIMYPVGEDEVFQHTRLFLLHLNLEAEATILPHINLVEGDIHILTLTNNLTLLLAPDPRESLPKFLPILILEMACLLVSILVLVVVCLQVSILALVVVRLQVNILVLVVVHLQVSILVLEVILLINMELVPNLIHRFRTACTPK